LEDGHCAVVKAVSLSVNATSRRWDGIVLFFGVLDLGSPFFFFFFFFFFYGKGVEGLLLVRRRSEDFRKRWDLFVASERAVEGRRD
jgi:hypothetical protein